ncbi:MAG: hypothetical protein F8N37_15425 [Telmatospirillum sp.]|nr:hypothetical protein [Telmatospirillum sp.]
MADIIQFHVLTAFPPHNVNRDEDGQPKICVYGGRTRGRISSQAKKRALRFAPQFPSGQRATRTREAGIKTFRALVSAGIDRESAVWAALTVNFALGGGDKCPKRDAATNLLCPPKKSDAEKREKEIADVAAKDGVSLEAAETLVIERQLRTDQGLVVGSAEFRRLEDRIRDLRCTWDDDRENFGERLAAWIDNLGKTGLLTDDDRDLDTALFGRMVAARPEFNVEAACALSHAFTTHEFSVEGDYFSAGEELNELRGTGAAITDYAFFGGGVYYQHAVLNVTDLRESLGSDERVANACSLFLDGLVLVQPKGKRNAFASDTVAAYVLATRGSDPAVSLGLAFLDPVPARGDVLASSIRRLETFHDTLRSAYDLKNEVVIFNAYAPSRQGDAPKPPEVWTLAGLRRFVTGGAS